MHRNRMSKGSNKRNAKEDREKDEEEDVKKFKTMTLSSFVNNT